jgi:hypothetical protein
VSRLFAFALQPRRVYDTSLASAHSATLVLPLHCPTLREAEWYDLFLRPGKHFVAFDAVRDGVGFDGIKTTLFGAWNPRRAAEMEAIAKQGREAALRLFDTKTMSCYTYYALHLYAAYQRD